ncbi:hypothetical protein B0H10DRAFT_1949969 [Mycena sp. CBHHK59/15]|nr:hypothetical protein B0H10DRAFT_1949969 [Mycena sp. CBHHK59/15]
MVATDGNRVHPAHAGKRKHTTTTTPPPPPLPSSIHMRAEGHGTHTWMSPAKKIAKRHSCSQGRKRVNDELKVDNLGGKLALVSKQKDQEPKETSQMEAATSRENLIALGGHSRVSTTMICSSGGPDRGLETRGKAQGARGCLKLEEHLRAEAEESLEGDKKLGASKKELGGNDGPVWLESEGNSTWLEKMFMREWGQQEGGWIGLNMTQCVKRPVFQNHLGWEVTESFSGCSADISWDILRYPTSGLLVTSDQIGGVVRSIKRATRLG